VTSPERSPATSVRDGLTANLVGVGLVVVVGMSVAALGGALGLAVGGRPQALGAVVGAGVTAGVSAFGTLTISVVAAYAPRASLLVALLTYALQVAVLALVLAAVQDSPVARSTLDVAWVGTAVVVTTVLWLVLLVVRALRSVPARPGESQRSVRR
jgi:ATP synthase protein I